MQGWSQWIDLHLHAQPESCAYRIKRMPVDPGVSYVGFHPGRPSVATSFGMRFLIHLFCRCFSLAAHCSRTGERERARTVGLDGARVQALSRGTSCQNNEGWFWTPRHLTTLQTKVHWRRKRDNRTTTTCPRRPQTNVTIQHHPTMYNTRCVQIAV